MVTPLSTTYGSANEGLSASPCPLATVRFAHIRETRGKRGRGDLRLPTDAIRLAYCHGPILEIPWAPPRRGRATTRAETDTIVRLVCEQYRTSVVPPKPLSGVDWQNSERSARALLAVMIAPSPTYLGAAQYIPIVDSLCRVARVGHLQQLQPDDTLRVALYSAFVGVDLSFEQAAREVKRMLGFLRHVGGDVAGFLAACHENESAREALSLLVREDPCSLQFLYDQLEIDARSEPTGGSSAVAVRTGLLSIADAVWGINALRESARLMLCEHPPELWHALQFMSDAVCDSYLGCSNCVLALGDAAPSGLGTAAPACTCLREGWL